MELAGSRMAKTPAGKSENFVLVTDGEWQPLNNKCSKCSWTSSGKKKTSVANKITYPKG